MNRRTIDRRTVLRGAASLGVLGMSAGPSLAAKRGGARGAGGLPARGSFVIRNAYVMTMDDAGDIANGDVHVANGAIVAVGPGLKAPGAATIDGRGTIVLPGFVETHWHMWNTLLRSMSGEKADHGYFRTTATLGQIIRAGRHVPGHAAFAARKRSTTASPSCTTGATTSAAPTMPTKICGRCGNPACARASPMARRRAWRTRTASTSPTCSGCTTTGRSFPTTA